MEVEAVAVARRPAAAVARPQRSAAVVAVAAPHRAVAAAEVRPAEVQVAVAVVAAAHPVGVEAVDRDARPWCLRGGGGERRR